MDILLSPSAEYEVLGPIHAQMAAFRAIENGVSMVRVAYNGVSIVTDPYGRVLARIDFYIIGVQLPTIVINIPLNNQLQTLDVRQMNQSAQAAARLDFEPR